MASAATGTVFVTEAFTDATDTELSAHNADWVDIILALGGAGFGAVARITAADRLRSDGTGTTVPGWAYYTNSQTPPSAEYDVRADLFVASNEAGAQAALYGRVAGDPLTGDAYQVVYDQSAGLWQLNEIVAGVATTLGTHTQALTVSQTYAVELRIRDAEKQVLIDGVSRISDATNTITAAGIAGVSIISPGGTDSVGYHLDNLVAQDVTGGVTATRYRMIVMG